MPSSSISARLKRAATLYGIGHGHGDAVRVKAGQEVRIVRRLDVDPARAIFSACILRDGVEFAANVRPDAFEADEAFPLTADELRSWAYMYLTPLYSYEELARTDDEDLAALVTCYREEA